MSLYNMKRTPDGYRVIKWDDLMNVEEVYNVTFNRGRFYCDCPAGSKGPTCRHRDMVNLFCTHRAVDKAQFYDYDLKEWVKIVC